jgi:Tol biopolymer transport system component
MEKETDMLYLADLETREITPVVPVEAGSDCSPPVWSPDGKRLAIGKTGNCALQREWVVDLEQDKTEELSFCSWGGVYHWTSDSRYVIYYCVGRRLGTGPSAAGMVFDTLEWETTRLPSESCNWDDQVCLNGPIAVSPTSPHVILENGKIVNLSDDRSTDICNSIDSAAWSPDGSLLAFASCDCQGQSACALYLAHGDGSQIKQIASTDDFGTGLLLWASDGRSVTFGERYVLDVEKLQVEAAPVSSSDETPYTWRADCGNVDTLTTDESSPLHEATAACWSPDSALLAVGEPNTLRVYDSRFNLLYSFPISGTISNIAWSPMP